MRAWRPVSFIVGTGVWWVIGDAYHDVERKSVFEQARKRADELKKPLVNYGCGLDTHPLLRSIAERSDVNIDIEPRNFPNFMLVQRNGTMRLPFEEKSTVIYCAHTLEHVDHPELLLKEFERISDDVYIIVPNPIFPQTWLASSHKRVFIGSSYVENPQRIAYPILIGMFLLTLL